MRVVISTDGRLAGEAAATFFLRMYQAAYEPLLPIESAHPRSGTVAQLDRFDAGRSLRNLVAGFASL
jgi:hypothetical protein